MMEEVQIFNQLYEEALVEEVRNLAKLFTEMEGTLAVPRARCLVYIFLQLFRKMSDSYYINEKHTPITLRIISLAHMYIQPCKINDDFSVAFIIFFIRCYLPRDHHLVSNLA